MSYTDYDFPGTHFYDTDLREMLCKVTKILKTVDELDNWKTEHEEEYKELKKLYDDLMAGNYPDSFVNSLTEWINKNAVDLIGELIKMVFFGLTDDGYFVAYIPDSWDDITFGTSGLDDFPSGIDFGHLTLIY